MAPIQGTSIGAAIDLEIRSFTPGEGRSKAMIIITDGEDHDDDPIAAAREAAKAGIIIHVVGIGTERGAPIPVRSRERFLTDIDGNTVITRLNEDILRPIAAETNGTYVRATNAGVGLDEIFREIKQMNTHEFESAMFTEYNDQFQIFAALALLLLIIEFIVMDRKNRKLANIRLFKIKM